MWRRIQLKRRFHLVLLAAQAIFLAGPISAYRQNSDLAAKQIEEIHILIAQTVAKDHAPGASLA